MVGNAHEIRDCPCGVVAKITRLGGLVVFWWYFFGGLGGRVRVGRQGSRAPVGTDAGAGWSACPWQLSRSSRSPAPGLAAVGVREAVVSIVSADFHQLQQRHHQPKSNPPCRPAWPVSAFRRWGGYLARAWRTRPLCAVLRGWVAGSQKPQSSGSSSPCSSSSSPGGGSMHALA